MINSIKMPFRVAGRDLTRAIDPIFFSDEQAMRAGARALTGELS
ncbi:hypothetical protein [Acetobacter estunensis]|nr:hypothetical protein [Acetobacter estunensis]